MCSKSVVVHVWSVLAIYSGDGLRSAAVYLKCTNVVCRRMSPSGPWNGTMPHYIQIIYIYICVCVCTDIDHYYILVNN